MDKSVQPATLAAASIVIQLCLLFIAFVTLWLLSRGYTLREAARDSYSSLVAWLLLALVMISLGEDQYATWGPLLGKLQVPSVPRDYSFLAVFVLDIIFTAVLILRTGGAKRSPFTSVLLLLPSLAIFLREPVGRFLFYSAVVGVLYVVLLRREIRKQSADYERSSFEIPAKEDEAVDDGATVWANITCLALATLIGYITQP
jgi:hypothetical protein